MQISLQSPLIQYDEKGNRLDEPVVYKKFPNLFMSHGVRDPIVPIRWAKTTFNELRVREKY